MASGHESPLPDHDAGPGSRPSRAMREAAGAAIRSGGGNGGAGGKKGRYPLHAVLPIVFMPTNRYIKELVEEGYIGRPYHLNLRYYTGYAREPGYGWRHDRAVAATGVLGNIASHFFYLAYWWFGEVTDVFCLAGEFVDRARCHAGREAV